MLGIENKEKDLSIGVAYMHYRKKPCLVVRRGNVQTKYASFNDIESAYLFLDEFTELLNMPKQDWRKEIIN